MSHDSDHFERHGWRGIGVTARLPFVDDAFVALATDPQTGHPALSVWRPDGPGHRREFAFWMDPEDARKLAAALLELAGPPAHLPAEVQTLVSGDILESKRTGKIYVLGQDGTLS